jgi:lipoprotein NlpI
LAREGKDDYKGALEDFNQSIALDSHNPEAYRNRAFLFYMAGKFQNCSESLTDILNAGQLSGDDLDTAWFYFWLARTRNGDADAATQDLTRYLKSRNGDSDFNGRIGQYLIGKLSEDDLLDAANSEDPRKDQEQHVSAQFYVASVKLIKNDFDGARPLFQKILDSQLTYMPEYQTTKVTMKAK